MAHLRNAMSRVNQEDTTSCGKAHLMAHARAAGMGMGKATEYIKAEQIGSAKWRVLAIPFGGPFKGGKDLDGEYFSPRTDVKASWFSQRPVLWHHGKDQELDSETLGTEDDLEKDSEGWWATMWLDRANRYWAQVNSLLQAGKVYGSSGALGHLVRKAPDGEILVWPHIEQTLTPTPANPFARVVPTKAVDDFTSAGLALDPALRGLLTEFDSQEADLGLDLPDEGGEDPAIQRLVGELARLEELIRKLR